LNQRVYVCEVCGYTNDRDLNAALNLAKVAESSSETQNACGGGRFMATFGGQVAAHEAGTEHQLGLS
jgi:transposase